jgi:hypothetical protein
MFTLKAHAQMDTIMFRHLYIAACNASNISLFAYVTSLHRDASFSRRELGSFDVMSLVRVGFSFEITSRF